VVQVRTKLVSPMSSPVSGIIDVSIERGFVTVMMTVRMDLTNATAVSAFQCQFV